MKIFIIEMENIVIFLSQSKVKDELLLDIIKLIIYENEFDESIKLRLFENIGF